MSKKFFKLKQYTTKSALANIITLRTIKILIHHTFNLLIIPLDSFSRAHFKILPRTTFYISSILTTTLLFNISCSRANGFEELSSDIVIQHIYSYLNNQEVSALSKVNKRLFTLSLEVPHLTEKLVRDQTTLDKIYNSTTAQSRLKKIHLNNSTLLIMGDEYAMYREPDLEENVNICYQSWEEGSQEVDAIRDLSLLKNLKVLTDLEISSGFPDQALKNVTFPESLTHLTLECGYLTSKFLSNFLWPVSSIQHISLSNLDAEIFEEESSFIVSFPKIQSFELIEPHSLPPISLYKYISSLYLSGRYTNKINLNVLNHLPLLSELEIGPCTNEAMLRTFNIPQSLKKLTINCINLDNQAIVEIHVPKTLNHLILANADLQEIHENSPFLNSIQEVDTLEFGLIAPKPFFLSALYKYITTLNFDYRNTSNINRFNLSLFHHFTKLHTLEISEKITIEQIATLALPQALKNLSLNCDELDALWLRNFVMGVNLKNLKLKHASLDQIDKNSAFVASLHDSLSLTIEQPYSFPNIELKNYVKYLKMDEHIAMTYEEINQKIISAMMNINLKDYGIDFSNSADLGDFDLGDLNDGE